MTVGTSIVHLPAMDACVREAAVALAQLLRTGGVTLYDGESVGASAVASAYAPRAVVVAFSVSGAARGTFALVTSERAGAELAVRLLGGVSSTLSARHLDVLREVGNIGASAFLNGVARALGRSCLPSVPSISHGDADDVVRAALAGRSSIRSARVVFDDLQLDLAVVIAD